MQFLISQPATIGGWVTALVFIVYSAVQFFDKRQRTLKKDSNIAEDRLVKVLEGTVNALEQKVNKQEYIINKQGLEINALTGKVDILEKEKIILTNILQGRDEQTQQFYKDSYIAMGEVKASNEYSKKNNDLLTKLVMLQEQLLKIKS